MKTTAGLLIALVATFLSGCAITTMDAKIAPTVMIQPSNIGAGREVGVVVSDERPSKDVGRRAAGGGAIRMTQDLPAIFQTAIMDGLSKKGFRTISGRSTGSNLKIEIRGLNLDPSVGLFTMGADIDAAMKAVATNGQDSYENMYRAASSNRTLVVSGAKASNEKLSAVVSEMIANMFADPKFLETLSASTAP